jgi:hypothetical protein
MSFLKNLFGGKKNDDAPAYSEPNLPPIPSPGAVMIAFEQAIGKTIELGDLREDQYTMWHPCDEDKQFVSSPLVGNWTMIYSITQSYWSYIFADLVKMLKLTDNPPFRLALPDELNTFAILTSDSGEVVLSVSKEKGIRLHFSEQTSFANRAGFLQQFANYCRAWKQTVDTNKGPKDNDLGFKQWWNQTVKVSAGIEEKGEPVLSVGTVRIR